MKIYENVWKGIQTSCTVCLFVYCLFEWHSIIYEHPAPVDLYVTIGIINVSHIAIQLTQGEIATIMYIWTVASTRT